MWAKGGALIEEALGVAFLPRIEIVWEADEDPSRLSFGEIAALLPKDQKPWEPIEGATPISAGYWPRISAIWPDEFAQFLFEVSPAIARNPAIGHCLTEGMKLLVEVAETNGEDVSKVRPILEAAIAKFYALELDSADRLSELGPDD